LKFNQSRWKRSARAWRGFYALVMVKLRYKVDGKKFNTFMLYFNFKNVCGNKFFFIFKVPNVKISQTLQFNLFLQKKTSHPSSRATISTQKHS
jgi:hypothetical protein